MKYLLALLMAALLIGGMFVFQNQMQVQATAWEAANVDLRPSQILLVRAMHQIERYWYLFAPLILVVCFGIAVIIPTSRWQDSSNQSDS